MGMDVAGSELPKINGEVKTKLHDQENGKINFSEEITFGSHGVEEQVKEVIKVSNPNVHQGAADEWGETKVHYFWFVRHRSFEDPSLRAKIDQADKEIQKKQQQINQLYEELKIKKTKRHELIQEKKALNAENDQYREFINEKREEMKPLQTALGSLRGGGGGGEKGYICSTEEELNQRIRSLEYQMQHESISLKEEKQLLKEIKDLEATRPKVVANTAARAKIQESLGKKEDIQDQVKLLGTDLDGVRKQQAAIKAKKERLNPLIDALSAEIDALEKEINNAKAKREEAFTTVKQIRKTINEKNSHLDEYRNNLNLAKEISFQKNVKALEEHHQAEVEKFMSQWSTSKAFREDYVKRSSRFNAGRMLSKDGRMLNDDEKPIVNQESPKPLESNVAPLPTPKPQKEATKNTPKIENSGPQQGPKESKKKSKDVKTTLEREVEEEEVFTVGKPKKDIEKDSEIDAVKLKEMKKEEEKEKQRQAFERKKKMQEKAAAKAAARAQKEAEKKQKEREKKLKKKEASTSPTNNEEELAENPETEEPENTENVEEVVEIPVPSKSRAAHPNSLKNRKSVKSRGAPPKAILKKKKSDKYLLYGSLAGGALLVMLLLVVGYKYFV